MSKKPKSKGHEEEAHEPEDMPWEEREAPVDNPHPEPEYQDPPAALGTLYVSEYIDVQVIGGRSLGVPLEPALAEQVVPIGPKSVQSNPFHPTTRFVRLAADSPCSVRFGSDPTATSSCGRLVGMEYRGVIPGLKLAVISNA